MSKKTYEAMAFISVMIFIIAGGFISNLAFKYFGTYAGLACMLFLAYILIRAARAVDNKFPHLSH